MLQSLFRPPLDKYDAVVLLHRENLPYPRRLLFPPKLNQGPKGGSMSPSLSFVSVAKSKN